MADDSPTSAPATTPTNEVRPEGKNDRETARLQRKFSDEKKYGLNTVEFGMQMEVLGSSFSNDGSFKVIPDAQKTLDGLLADLPPNTAASLQKFIKAYPEELRSNKSTNLGQLMETGQTIQLNPGIEHNYKTPAEDKAYTAASGVFEKINSTIHTLWWVDKAQLNRDDASKYQDTLKSLRNHFAEKSPAMLAAYIGGAARSLQNISEVHRGKAIVEPGAFDELKHLDPVAEKPLIDALKNINDLAHTLYQDATIKPQAYSLLGADAQKLDNALDTAIAAARSDKDTHGQKINRVRYVAQLRDARRILEQNNGQFKPKNPGRSDAGFSPEAPEAMLPPPLPDVVATSGNLDQNDIVKSALPVALLSKPKITSI